MVTHNKLVRDKIPNIIVESGKKCKIRELSYCEYMDELNKKLMEECEEVAGAKNVNEIIEEIADVMEVLLAMCDLYSISINGEVESARLIKAVERGTFKDRILLESVDE